MTTTSTDHLSPSPEILLLQEMTDASFRQMDQDRMLHCCTAGLTKILGGQGAAILVEEVEDSWSLNIYTDGKLSAGTCAELKINCMEAFNAFSKSPILPEACRLDIQKPRESASEIKGLSPWTPIPLRVDEKFQGLLLVDLAGEKSLPTKLNIVLHQLCTGLLSIRNMHQLLITDPMTGCYNRWFMDIELSKFCEGSSPHNDEFAVMELDVDHFKQINDQYGHSSGDRVLVQLSDMLRNRLSHGDAAIRMGGDEFLLWFPRVRGRELHHFGNELLRDVAAELKLESAPDLQITLSVGFVQHDPTEKAISKEQLLERADHALYASKRNGRNQLSIWSPQEEKASSLGSEPDVKNPDQIRNLMFRLQKLQNQRDQDQESLIDMLTNLLSIKEVETGLHSFRVANMTAYLLEHLERSEEEKTAIYRGAKLHDIGKIAIPEAILHKQGKLSESEWTIIRQHPQLGNRILENQKFLESACDIVLYHHECYDGSGYPKGLTGEEIPFGARLFSLVDAYDTMRANRVYKSSMPKEEVIEELKRKSGSQFDPTLLEFFLQHVDKIEEIGYWES